MNAEEKLRQRGASEEELKLFRQMVEEGLPWGKLHLYNSMIESKDTDLHLLAVEGIFELMAGFGMWDEIKEQLDIAIEGLRNIDLSSLPEDRQVLIKEFLQKVDEDKEGFGEGKV